MSEQPPFNPAANPYLPPQAPPPLNPTPPQPAPYGYSVTPQAQTPPPVYNPPIPPTTPAASYQPAPASWSTSTHAASPPPQNNLPPQPLTPNAYAAPAPVNPLALVTPQAPTPPAPVPPGAYHQPPNPYSAPPLSQTPEATRQLFQQQGPPMMGQPQPLNHPPAPIAPRPPGPSPVMNLPPSPPVQPPAPPAPAVPAPEPTADPKDEANSDPGKATKFSQTIWRTLASTVLPTSGLIKPKKTRIFGIVVTSLLVLSLVAGATYAFYNRTATLTVMSNPSTLKFLTFALGGLALLWVVNIVGTYMVNRPAGIKPGQRVGGAFIVLLLSVLMSVPMAVGANYTWKTADMVGGIFETGEKSPTIPVIEQPGRNPWDGIERVNILLLGVDTAIGKDAWSGIRPDSTMVASINTETGNVVFFQIPRNMARTPFSKDTELGKKLAAQYPNGFYDGVNGDNPEYMFNAIYNNVPGRNRDLFKNSPYPGADAVKIAVSGALGIPIHYFMMINFNGMKDLIDAMGGVTVNVNYNLPIGGGAACGRWGVVKQGPNQHLMGYKALWYARSRCKDPLGDFGRMQRQTCLMKAIIAQADPMTMLAHFNDLADAATKMMATDIPADMLGPIAELALKVKSGKQSRLAFIHGKNGFVTGNPDYPKMRKQVQRALDLSDGKVQSTGTGKGPVESLIDACLYNPQKKK